jgi:activator of 2-hydroxyglutaryl-CoA dehydratase
MMPGFIAAAAGWEQTVPDMDEDCTADCGECMECMAIAAEVEAEDLADQKRKGDWR